VGACVLHGQPGSLGSEVRRGLLETGGALRVRLQAGGVPADTARDVAIFERVVAAVGAEFRRREHLAGSLASVMPLLSSLNSPVDLPLAAWAD